MRPRGYRLGSQNRPGDEYESKRPRDPLTWVGSPSSVKKKKNDPTSPSQSSSPAFSLSRPSRGCFLHKSFSSDFQSILVPCSSDLLVPGLLTVATYRRLQVRLVVLPRLGRDLPILDRRDILGQCEFFGESRVGEEWVLLEVLPRQPAEWVQAETYEDKLERPGVVGLRFELDVGQVGHSLVVRR